MHHHDNDHADEQLAEEHMGLAYPAAQACIGSGLLYRIDCSLEWAAALPSAGGWPCQGDQQPRRVGAPALLPICREQQVHSDWVQLDLFSEELVYKHSGGSLSVRKA